MSFFSQNMKLGLGGHNKKRYLQEILFNLETGLPFDAKGNMPPILNQVPCSVFGTDDYVDFSATPIDPRGKTIGFYLQYTDSESQWFDFGLSDEYKIAGTFNSERNAHVSSVSFSWDYGIDGKIEQFISHSVALTINQFYFIEIDVNLQGEITAARIDGNNFDNAVGAQSRVDGSRPTQTRIGVRSTNAYAYDKSIAYIKIDDEIIPFQQFLGDKVYSLNNIYVGTWNGTGQRYTRKGNIPNINQLGCKIVQADEGTGYFPLAVSDAELHSQFTNTVITSVYQNSKGTIYIDDGSFMNLRSETSNLPIKQRTVHGFNPDNSHIVFPNNDGNLYGYRFEFYVKINVDSFSSQGIFGATDALGRRYDVCLSDNNQIRVFHPKSEGSYHSTAAVPNWEVGSVYKITVQFNDYLVEPDVWVNGDKKNLVGQSTVGVSNYPSKYYIHTIGSGVGVSSYDGLQTVGDVKVFDPNGKLVHYWKCDETSGVVVNDYGSNETNGTIHGSDASSLHEEITAVDWTLSQYLEEYEALSGIDLTQYKAGSLLPIIFKYELGSFFTKGIKLIKP